MKFVTCRTRGCGRSIEEDFHVLETLYLLVFRHTHDAFTQLLMTTRKRERFAASRSTSIIRSKSSMIFYRSSKWTLSLFMILVFVQYYFFSVDLLGHVFFTLMITIEFWLFIYIFFSFFLQFTDTDYHFFFWSFIISSSPIFRMTCISDISNRKA